MKPNITWTKDGGLTEYGKTGENPNQTKTEYRTISDGYKNFLQYKTRQEKKYTILFFFTITIKAKWDYIWRPYYDSIYGRSLDSTGTDTFVTAYNNNFKGFTNKWVYIKDYFKYAWAEQKRLQDKVREKNEKIEQQKGTINYINNEE